MSSNDKRRTASSVSLEEDYPHTRSPYLEVGILRAANLSEFKYLMTNPHPYVYITQKNKEWESNMGKYMYNNYVWGEFFELDIDFAESFSLILYDKDEFGEDSVISGFVIDPSMLLKCTSHIWLKLNDKGEISKLTPDLMGSESTKEPVLLIQIKQVNPEADTSYSVKIHHHKNLVLGKKSFTVYQVKVLRSDGAHWKTELRFSDVVQLRNNIVKVLPKLRKVKFPSKTYLDCFSRFWKGFSRFHLPRIKERKKLMEDFLNSALEHIDTIKCDSFLSLLRIVRVN